jgi:hypothetical protein
MKSDHQFSEFLYRRLRSGGHIVYPAAASDCRGRCASLGSDDVLDVGEVARLEAIAIDDRLLPGFHGSEEARYDRGIRARRRRPTSPRRVRRRRVTPPRYDLCTALSTAVEIQASVPI